jgi:glutamine---fructose-6-phosphate transaminase (isomerizing)
VELRESAPEKDGFETFMAKEMAEQPAAVGRTVFERLGPDGVELDLGVDDATLGGLRALRIVACGTSYHAGLVARAMIEEWARLPVEVEVASEHRARTPLTGPGDLLLGISQSGETADTLAAMRLARSRGATVLALTNVRGSQVTREADGVLFTEAGTEVGVAATKTFTAQVAALALLALRLAEARGTLPGREAAAIADDLRRLPDLIERSLVAAEPWARRAADALAEAPLVMFLGRHAGTAVAQEGALKLKEVAYVPCDAYAAGEMKHGPIALLAPGTPVVCVATDAPMLEKLLSNMAEVRARGAHVLAVVTEGDDRPVPYADDVVAVPPVRWELQPLLAVLPLQRLAHDVAAARGLNVDQPRNLAKTVTVE